MKPYLLDGLGVFFDGYSAEKDGGSEAAHVFGESFVFFRYLEGEFASVAKDENGDLTFHWLQLLQSRQHENSGFAHS